MIETVKEKIEERADGSSAHWVAAAVLSILIPGSGQWLRGERKRAYILLSLWFVVELAELIGRVTSTYAGFIVWMLTTVILYVVAGVLTALGSRSQWKVTWAVIAGITAAFVGAVSIDVATRAAGFSNYSIPSSSMHNTIMQGDYIMVDKHYYRDHPVHRGDLVVFQRPEPDTGKMMLIVKRAVAVSGDTVEVRDRVLYINHEGQDEPYVVHERETLLSPVNDLFHTDNFGPIRVPEHTFFAVGDNRDVSLDSRSYGSIKEDLLVGKPLYIYKSERDRTGKAVR
jgi:signal peptidase I